MSVDKFNCRIAHFLSSSKISGNDGKRYVAGFRIVLRLIMALKNVSVKNVLTGEFTIYAGPLVVNVDEETARASISRFVFLGS